MLYTIYNLYTYNICVYICIYIHICICILYTYIICIDTYIIYICTLPRISCSCIHQAKFKDIFSEFCLNINKKKILNINTKYSSKH